ncbi:MAG: caspase family protein, partial [Planctomycetes bacterium]|nr:caspase family protein [Planctomycetota bacterium]
MRRRLAVLIASACFLAGIASGCAGEPSPSAPDAGASARVSGASPGAGSVSDRSAPPARSSETAGPADLSRRLAGLLPDLDPKRSGGASASGGGRYALIVGADEYRARKDWNIPFARRSADLMKSSLKAHAGFRDENVLELLGDKVSADEIEAALTRDLPSRMRGPGNLLLVYYAGHGMDDAAKGSHLFTYYTAPGAGGAGYEKTVPWASLQKWIAAGAASTEKSGGSVATVLLIDACRTDTGAPPDPVVVEA